MRDYNALIKTSNGNFVFEDTGEVLKPLFQEGWDCPEAYFHSGVKSLVPMTAKELETQEQQEEYLNSDNNIIEEKFDGTRGIVQFFSQPTIQGGEVGYSRVFSRRISKKTNFFAENTDNLPQIRDIDKPEMSGTVLDGELFIPNRPFKDISSTLNCLWDKAVERQLDLGFGVLHAFDILFYKGIDLRRLPLHRRKVYLHLAIEELDSPYIVEVPYYNCGSDNIPNPMDLSTVRKFLKDEGNKKYSELYSILSEDIRSTLTPRAYYEAIVFSGGEGVIVKPKSERYYHKRGKQYLKIKKFLTRELILMGFTKPTKEYTGKDLKNWGYWVRKKDLKRVMGNYYGNSEYLAVTKNYYYNQIGNLRLGVVISDEECSKLPKNKTFNIEKCNFFYGGEEHLVLEVCDCGGIDDNTRDYYTRHQAESLGTVIEVKANEIHKDTGRLRHPRYLRKRYDKSAEACTWSEHINQ